MGFRTEEELPQMDPALQPRTDADEDIPSCRDKKDNYGPQKRAGSDTYFPRGEHSEFFDRPVTESVTARAGSDTDFPSGEHSELFGRPVTESVTARAGSDTEILVMNVSTVATEQSELREMVLGETVKRGIPVYRVECTPERRRPENISPGALQQVEMSNNQWNCVDYCCGVCGKAYSVNRSGTGSCWNCCCLIVWGYRVSCLVVIVIRDRFYGIDLFSEGRCVFTRGPVLVGNPVWPCDVIRVYTKMNGNFKGGMDSVVMRSDDPVDSRYLQRWADDRHRSLEHASVRGKQIREKGQFGCVDTPVHDADWSVEYSVGPIPVGDIRIDYLRDPVDRRQSTDAAPLTELLLFYTLRRLRNYCAAEYIPCWTFCDTVWNPLRIEGLLLRRGAVQACQAMEGAVLVDNRASVTFDAELCIPWDAPRVVIDETSTMAFRLVPRPHRVVLLGRDEDVNDRRILPDGDSRAVRFRRPELHRANRESGDVALLVQGEAGEPPTSELTKYSSPGIPTLGTAVQSPQYNACCIS